MFFDAMGEERRDTEWGQTERHRERWSGDRQRGTETDREAQREREWGQTERHRDRGAQRETEWGQTERHRDR